jgi:hypothetical protein
LEKHEEAAASLEEFIAALPSIKVNPAEEPLVFRAMAILAKQYSVKTQVEPLIALSEKIVARFDSFQKDPTLYEELSGPPYRLIRRSAILIVALSKAVEDSTGASLLIDDWLNGLSPEESSEIPTFFKLALSLTILFGPERVAGWIHKLLAKPLPEPERLLASWHLLAVELLAREDATEASSPQLPDNLWARIPPELRQNVEDLVRQMRAMRESIKSDDSPP